MLSALFAGLTAVLAKAGATQAKMAANWIMGEVASQLNRDSLDIEASPVSAAQLAVLIARIADGTISNKIAKEIFNPTFDAALLKPTLGDSAGVFGAAMLVA